MSHSVVSVGHRQETAPAHTHNEIKKPVSSHKEETGFYVIYINASPPLLEEVFLADITGRSSDSRIILLVAPSRITVQTV
jgi:hypothetical protein